MQAQVKKSPKDANKMFSANVPNDDATSFFFKHLLIHYMYVCTCHSTHVGVRRTALGVSPSIIGD